MRQHHRLHRLIALAAGVALIAAACGSDERSKSPVGSAPATESSSPVSSSATSPGSGTGPEDSGTGGWVDGEPAWGGESDGAMELAVEAPGDFDAPAADSGAMTVDGETDRSSTGGPGERSPLPEPIDDRPLPGVIDDTPLRAGSVDDNEDFEGFLGYLERIDGLGIRTRPLDPTGRTIVQVVDAEGGPVAGALVTVTAGQTSTRLRTTADGSVRFHPSFYGMESFGFEVEVGDVVLADVTAGTTVTIESTPNPIAAPVPLDVLFLLDATGSMGDEIGRLKDTIDLVAERVARLDPAPDVRFAMTLYRDEGDAFVTATYDFTGDIAEFQNALADVVADGGGDYPEALDEGLADALAEPAWRDPAQAVQLIFVVADAPPQVGRQVETPYTDSIRTAIERGIKIFPVASSESDDQAEAVFRQMAQATGAPFVFLSNGAAGAATGPSTDITTTDYEELALDELVVRLIAEELSDLGGSGQGNDVTIPTTIAPPTTNPDGQ